MQSNLFKCAKFKKNIFFETILPARELANVAYELAHAPVPLRKYVFIALDAARNREVAATMNGRDIPSILWAAIYAFELEEKILNNLNVNTIAAPKPQRPKCPPPPPPPR